MSAKCRVSYVLFRCKTFQPLKRTQLKSLLFSISADYFFSMILACPVIEDVHVLLRHVCGIIRSKVYCITNCDIKISKIERKQVYFGNYCIVP